MRVNRGDNDEGIWLMDFIYIYKTESLVTALSGA
jgi:hypothetical protein